jgi:hypothetical protein
VSDSVATTVHDLATTWEALLDVDLIEVGRRRRWSEFLVPFGCFLMFSCTFCAAHAPTAPTPMRLRDMASSRWTKVGGCRSAKRPRDEIALGPVGKFWHPRIELAAVSAADFRDFARPGFAKTIYSLSARRIDASRTLITGVMRTATTDEHARRWFRRYWTFGVGSGAHVLVNGLLDVTRELAEARVHEGAA